VRLLYNNVAERRQDCGFNDFGSIFRSRGSRLRRPVLGSVGAAAANITTAIFTIAATVTGLKMETVS
jgi:hypothetical protein